MTNIAEPFVARGVAWLDEHYPGWFKAIDLETLDVSKCDICVLGQVYSGHVPYAERQQLLAQVIAKDPGDRRLYGFDLLVRRHELKLSDTMAMGFTSWRWCNHPHHRDEGLDSECPDVPTFDDLLEAWTQAIIQKRLEAQPETLDRISQFWSDPSAGVGIERPKRDLVGA